MLVQNQIFFLDLKLDQAEQQAGTGISCEVTCDHQQVILILGDNRNTTIHMTFVSIGVKKIMGYELKLFDKFILVSSLLSTIHSFP